MARICLDAGILGIYFSPNCTSKVTALIDRIKAGTDEAHMLKPVLSEAFFNICKVKGKDKANQSITSFTRSVPIIQVDLDESLILFTGLLKCQHRDTLSYIDCMVLAYCINNKLVFHTTEKTLKQRFFHKIS
jgi:predicted nucleic acid-binding protein